MNDILIKKTPNADTRSSNGEMNVYTVLKDTENHIEAVQKVLAAIGVELKNIGEIHDHSKVSNIEEFTEALGKHADGTQKIKKSDWWKKHKMERHHLNDRVPSDVNLLDVLEMVVDGVVAGKARTGDVYPIELTNAVLQEALQNTQKILIGVVKVEDDE